MKREIKFYKDREGRSPVEEFLNELPSKEAQKAAWVLRLAQDLERVPAKYFTKLTGTKDMWEFRIKYGSNIYRILAFQDGKNLICTHGFIKKTQKTPREEIERAQRCQRDHLSR